MGSAGALDGIRVLDLSTVGPGARCTRILADYGASVIKVGAPAGSGAAVEPPPWAYGAGRGTRRIRIDLKASAGRTAFLRLAAGADVLLESFRPGVADRLGIGYAHVRGSNPGIVYCSTSGYGRDGPYAGWAGHDLDYLAVAGFLDLSGRRPDGGPALPGATIADAAGGGMHAAIAILAALLGRRATGEGAYLDVSVAEGVLSLTALAVDRYLATGETPAPGSDLLTGRYACYDVYRARDGRWLAVAAIEPVFYANLCRALGLERWIPHQLDDARQDQIRAELRAAFARKDRDAWVAELAPRDTCVAPVLSVPELVADPHLQARRAFADAVRADGARLRQVAPVLAGCVRSAEPPAAREPGESHAVAVLTEAGLPRPEIDKLVAQGVVA